MVIREEFVAEARTWLGTRFHHQGRLKATAAHKGGCDCIGLVVGVLRDLQVEDAVGQLLYKQDRTDYGRIPDGDNLKRSLGQHLHEIAVEEIQLGDIVLFRFDQNPQHVGIISDYPHGGLGVIHCYAQARKVVEHQLNSFWQERLVTAFSITSFNG